jgi:hypothetical protein
MTKRSSIILQAEANRLLKAARAAGYARARLITHPDGRIEVIGEDVPANPESVDRSPFEQWKAGNAR